VVWNGQEYAIAYVDWPSARLYFRRIFADGTADGPSIQLSASPSYAGVFNSPALVWNGNGYGVAWLVQTDAICDLFFLRLDRFGQPLGPELQISNASAVLPVCCPHIYNPTIAWSGNQYAVVWQDNRNSGANDDDLFATLINADGTIAGNGALHDLVVCDAPGTQERPALAWNSMLGYYLVVWMDDRTGPIYSYSRRFGPLGNFASEQLMGDTTTFFPSLCQVPDGLALSWTDLRDGGAEIYFARLTAFGALDTPEVQLTYNLSGAVAPKLIWTGAEFGVFWIDNHLGGYQVFFQRVSASGIPLGPNFQVTFSSMATYEDAAFARYGYLLTYDVQPGTNFVEAIGCVNDTTPPSCPTNLLAYNVTGTSTTVSWGPSGDTETDLAYYLVYRDNNPIAKTSDTFYMDSGLSPNGTYNYMVQPVNAAQLLNYACGNSIYVRTNPSLTLMLNKETRNAVLSWTDAQPLGSYNVFRGTSPQVMQKIGSASGQSFTDPNALMDSNLYFYTVDEP
jgi:hypothetical protein